MSKPEKQKASGVALLIDGVVAKRVQTFGSSTDITREQAQELANSGVVEYIADSPTVSVQIDSNMVGSTDLMALLTDRLLDYDKADEADLARGGTYRFFVKSASSNAAVISEQDMLDGYCSITATLNEEGTAAARTMWMNHCAVTGMTLTYDVNGNASENYTLAADNKTWFLGDWGFARCYKPINNQIGYHSTGLAFSGLDSCLPTNSSVLAVGINNFILRSTASGSGVTGNATFASTSCATDNSVLDGRFVATSYALSTPWMSTASGSSDRCWVIYKPLGNLWEATSNPVTDPGWELESESGATGALRRGNIKAYLWNTQTSGKATYAAAGKALRLQTVTIDVALGEEQLFELGTDGFYAISKNTPVPITVTISANDSDLEYFAALTGQDSDSIETISISDFNGTNSLRVEVYQDKAQTTLLQTIEISDMYVQTENFNISVGDNAVGEMTFSTDNITITGSGTNVVGGWYGAK